MNWYKKAQKYSKPSEYLVVKDQLAKLFGIWGIQEPVPTKGKKVVIPFPVSEHNQYSLGIVTLSDKKSTYGKPLWKVVLTNELV